MTLHKRWEKLFLRELTVQCSDCNILVPRLTENFLTNEYEESDQQRNLTFCIFSIAMPTSEHIKKVSWTEIKRIKHLCWTHLRFYFCLSLLYQQQLPDDDKHAPTVDVVHPRQLPPCGRHIIYDFCHIQVEKFVSFLSVSLYVCVRVWCFQSYIHESEKVDVVDSFHTLSLFLLLLFSLVKRKLECTI